MANLIYEPWQNQFRDHGKFSFRSCIFFVSMANLVYEPWQLVRFDLSTRQFVAIYLYYSFFHMANLSIFLFRKALQNEKSWQFCSAFVFQFSCSFFPWITTTFCFLVKSRVFHALFCGFLHNIFMISHFFRGNFAK